MPPPPDQSPHDKLIHTERAAQRLRERIIDVERKRVLIARISDSVQAKDLTVPPNCGGFGRVRHFRRKTEEGWPPNPLPIDPAARALKLAPTDLVRAQAFQNAACAWRCWYCFVPFSMLAGNQKTGAWMTVDELLDLYLAEVNRPSVIDLTGGSPDLTPEWVLWFMRALKARGLEKSVYLWSDDNLSTGYFWRYLSEGDRAEMVSYPMYGRVACFKGFDETSFSFNTQADTRAFANQFVLMERLISLGLDCYAYITFTTPTTKQLEVAMRGFVDRFQRIHHNLPLRTVPLRIEPFSPVVPRLNPNRRAALLAQYDAIAAWNAELSKRFSDSERQLRIDQVVLNRG